jgi:hypothetical protein
MIETYYAGSYWLARPESAEACAHRAESFFHLLGRCDPVWNRWYQPGNSFEEARKRQVKTDAASFQNLFAKEEHQIAEGFSFGLWTGDTSLETSTIDTRCGLADRCISRGCAARFPHCLPPCVLNPWRTGAPSSSSLPSGSQFPTRSTSRWPRASTALVRVGRAAQPLRESGAGVVDAGDAGTGGHACGGWTLPGCERQQCPGAEGGRMGLPHGLWSRVLPRRGDAHLQVAAPGNPSLPQP